MKKTTLLGLPIYDKPSEDKFKLNDWNIANENIERAFSSAINGKSLNIINTEVAEARGGEVNLKSKIGKIDAQLEQKVQKNEVRLKAVKNRLEDCDETMLLAIRGGNETSFNLLSIPQDNSVTFEKTDFLKVGKNLYNENTTIKGYYVDYLSGNLKINENAEVSEYIPILPSTTYTLSNQNTIGQIKDLGQLAFYDIDKKYVSGLINSGLQQSTTFTTAENVHYIRITTENTKNKGIMLELGSNMTSYEPYKYEIPNLVLSEKNIGSDAVKDINISKESNIVVKKIGKNLFDKSTAIEGYYIKYDNGKLDVNPSYHASDFIKVSPGETYTQSPLKINGKGQQLAFYNSEKVYISGIVDDVTFTIPNGVEYLRLTVLSEKLEVTQLELGSKITSYEEYGYFIPQTDLPKEALQKASNNIITVKKTGGDFSSLRLAIESIKDTSENNPYTIEIYEGTYDVLEDYSVEEMNSNGFIGLVKPNYVSFKGIGDKSKIIVKCFLPNDELSITTTRKGQISTLNPYGNGIIENITFEGKNLRYVVHDDFNYPNALLHVKNCDFIRYKGNGINYGGKQAWGEGSWNGQRKIFEDCKFYTEWENYYAYTTHNTQGNTMKSFHKFINCKFFSTLSGNAIRFSSMDGQEEEVIMIGTKSNGAIHVEPIAPYIGDKYKISGYGNDIVPVKFSNTDGTTSTYEFAGETRKMYNGSASGILKGQPIMLSSTGTSITLFIGSGKIRFFGIAEEDISQNSSGIVKVGGYLNVANTGLTGLAIGDKIGVVNGNLAKVTDSEYIGYVAINNFIKLI